MSKRVVKLSLQAQAIISAFSLKAYIEVNNEETGNLADHLKQLEFITHKKELYVANVPETITIEHPGLEGRTEVFNKNQLP